jgi:hypothetical protein
VFGFVFVIVFFMVISDLIRAFSFFIKLHLRLYGVLDGVGKVRIRSVDQIIGPEVFLLFVFGWSGVRPGALAR